jgi:very-short-patch-repair endonuclease
MKSKKGKKPAQKFLELWSEQAGATLVPEYKFLEDRKFRFDFALPKYRLAIEIDGGVFGMRGRHIRPLGFQKDAEKGRRACEAGWRVWHFTTKCLTKDEIARCIEAFEREMTLRSLSPFWNAELR